MTPDVINNNEKGPPVQTVGTVNHMTAPTSLTTQLWQHISMQK